MNKQQQSEHFDNLIGKMKSILISKSQDYAQQIDVLSNFKLAGTICGLTPELNCLSLIATKVARLGVLLKSENAPNNESIRDSILDLANYAVLLDMIQAERENCVKVATQKECENLLSGTIIVELPPKED